MTMTQIKGFVRRAIYPSGVGNFTHRYVPLMINQTLVAGFHSAMTGISQIFKDMG